MRHSESRILTTHVGRLQRPEALTTLLAGDVRRPSDVAFGDILRRAVGDIVGQQADLGLDIVCDGELGRPSWNSYLHDRLSGHELVSDDVPPSAAPTSRDRAEFADFYDEMRRSGATYYRSPGGAPPAGQRWACTGPVSYIGTDMLRQDLDNLAAAMGAAKAIEAFIPATSPIRPGENAHYATDEDYYVAIGEAMRVEYRAIVDAGFVLQIDDPHLPDTWDHIEPHSKNHKTPTLAEFRAAAAKQVEIINHALRGIPEDRIRYHVCWGSWHGPHAHDVPLRDIVDIMLDVHAGAYVIEAANARHEHEWMVWRDVKLPDGKLLVPGVISHATNVVEHPDLVAWRLRNFAGVVGRDNIIASTDCGLGYRVHPQIAWAKLKSLVEGASRASRDLW